ncbi:MAG: VTT domain-containing protein [Lachnospiraceae bacterium]|jgi:uncharacterized membrane protein YdjX (TVP38/TMEM64 family)|nr:VTT domain-containing protein [Lachnospiraceae bacterium]MCI1327542.1 VTT domain-containing protein [Lachnospiraceae bacterium]
MAKKEKSKKIWRLVLFIALLALAVFLLWLFFGDTLTDLIKLVFSGKEDAVEGYLKQNGAWKGLLSTFILSALQVISIFFPGFAIQIAAGVIFGWGRAFLACYFGYVFGNILVFFVARKLGDQITDLIPTSKRNRESSMKLIEKMKSTRPTLVVAVANLLPIIPNGIIPYIAARSSIRNIRFTEAIMATCWIQIFFNCLAGGFLKHGQIGFMIGALAIQILLLVVVSKEGNRIMDWALRIENKLKSKNS